MAKIISTALKIWHRLLNTRPRGFWPGFAVGSLYFAYIFLWMWSTVPLRALGIESRLLSIPLVAVFYIGSVIQMAAGTGLFGLFLAKLSRRDHSPSFFPLFIAAGFTLSEYLRSWFLGLAPLGQGSVLGPHWTFGNIAYWFSDFAPLRQSSSLWGIYGVTFLVALAAASLYVRYRSGRYPTAALAVLAAMGTLTVLNFAFSPAKPASPLPDIPVAIVQTEQTSRPGQTSDALFRDLREKLELLDQLPGQAASGSLTVLPEGANLFQEISVLLDASGLQRYLKRFAPAGITIIDNGRVTEEDRARSRTVALDPSTGQADYYDKNLLTPGGEFLPYWIQWPSDLFGIKETAQVQVLRSFAPGKRPNKLVLAGREFTVLICSEAISPEYARRNNSDFIIAQSSLAIFSGSDRIQSQLMALARFRSAENRKYLVWASNYGRSFIVNDRGNVERIASSGGYQILTGEIVPNTARTWYNTLGDWPILSLSLLLAGWSLKKNRV